MLAFLTSEVTVGPIGGPLVAHLAFVVLLVGSRAFFSWLTLQNRRYGARTLRREREWVDERLGMDDPEQVIAYQRAKTTLSEVSSWTTLVVVLVVLYSGAFALAVEWLTAFDLGTVLAGTLFFVGALVGLQLLSVPFEYYDTFVIEERFEFNNQTPTLFVRDLLVQLVISSVIVAVLAAGVIWFVVTLTWWPLAALALFAGFSLTMLVVYPRVIAPLFNDFDPVEAGPLRESVEAVFDRAGFACEEIYVMDASRRSGHSNAYFTGFGRSKRVVLFDTLVDQLEFEQIEAILAHELAHWKCGHIWKGFAASQLRIGILLAVLWVLVGAEWLYAMFATPETAYVGLALGALWLGPLSAVSQPLENRLSLAHEREADTVATAVMGDGEPLVEALCRLADENLMNPFPHQLYATFHYTHPPIPDRIKYLEQLGDEVDVDSLPVNVGETA